MWVYGFLFPFSTNIECWVSISPRKWKIVIQLQLHLIASQFFVLTTLFTISWKFIRCYRSFVNTSCYRFVYFPMFCSLASCSTNALNANFMQFIWWCSALVNKSGAPARRARPNSSIIFSDCIFFSLRSSLLRYIHWNLMNIWRLLRSDSVYLTIHFVTVVAQARRNVVVFIVCDETVWLIKKYTLLDK